MNPFQVGTKAKPAFLVACTLRLTPFRRICCLLVLIGLTAVSAFSQTVFLDFNAPGQYTGNFNPWNDATGVNAGNYCFAEGTGWAKGGMVAWAIVDGKGVRKAKGKADGVPVWGGVAVVADKDGGFSIFF